MACASVLIPGKALRFELAQIKTWKAKYLAKAFFVFKGFVLTEIGGKTIKE